MNIAQASIRYKTITLVLTALIIVGGVISYRNLGRLEDPEFTIKEAQVFTRYPGATAMEVAEEVTDKIETAVQQLGQIKRVTSISEPGLSTIRVVMKDKYDKHTLPQVWDELRRKVNDMQSTLPPGSTTSIVNDDFGDVYGVFVAIYGDGFNYAELNDYVKILRRELLLVQDVGKVAVYGEQEETIYVEISRERLAQLGISPERIYASLTGGNLAESAGNVKVGDMYLRVDPTGQYASVEELGDVLILQGRTTETNLYLKDIADIRRGYVDPPKVIMHYNGRPAIGLGISTVLGGNVVTMGNALKKRLVGLQEQTPIGVELGVIALQSDAVTASVNGFIVNLVEALAIVIGVLLFAMGLRSALLIGMILLLTILSTFIIMDVRGVMLERISLGALIIALGMLVDNAIVVVEGILVNLQKDMPPEQAASKIVGQTIWPLFGATVVAILAFAAIGASQDSTGEYCRSLFQVILYSLLMSWVLAVTVTPLFGVMFLKVKPISSDGDPYAGILFQIYKKFLCRCLKWRWFTIAVLVTLMGLAVFGFAYVKISFFPDSTRPQFMVHYWTRQGSHITSTEADIKQIESHVMTMPGVVDVSSFIGKGSLRFMLTYTPEEANTAYAMLLVTVEDYKHINGLMTQVDQYVKNNFPDVLSFSRRFVMGPGDAQKIQARLRGADPNNLRELADEVKQILIADPVATDIMDNWRDRTPLIRPSVIKVQARDAGLTRTDIARAFQTAFEGTQIGVYREGDELLKIIARRPYNERSDVAFINDMQIWSPVAQRAIPMGQVISGFESKSENDIIRRRNRLPTLTVKSDPDVGQASELLERVKPKIEARFDDFIRQRQLAGYSLEWGGEYENSNDAQKALKRSLPVVALLMVLVVIFLFNSIRKPVIIFLTVPLALIGVTAGLLMADQPFGFMAILGFLSLSGMLIKNSIVLIDEINQQLSQGKDPLPAVIDSAVSRVRPVSMAALTTVLGMIPLLADAFFVSMAVTIMFGLSFATVLTLIVIPLLFTLFFQTDTSRAGL